MVCILPPSTLPCTCTMSCTMMRHSVAQSLRVIPLSRHCEDRRWSYALHVSVARFKSKSCHVAVQSGWSRCKAAMVQCKDSIATYNHGLVSGVEGRTSRRKFIDLGAEGTMSARAEEIHSGGSDNALANCTPYEWGHE